MSRQVCENAKTYFQGAKDWFWKLSQLEKFTLALVIFTAIYAVVTIELYRVTRESADANVTAVRAWVYPADLQPPAPSTIHVGTKFFVKFENGGKTPATEIIVTEEFKYWPRSTGVVMPEFDRCQSGSHFSAQPYKLGAISANQRTEFIGLPIEKLQATPEQLARLPTLREGLLVHICIQYQTVTGQVGLTDYCSVAYGADLTATAPCVHNALVLR